MTLVSELIRGTPADICMHLILPQTRVIGLHFLSLIVWVYLHLNLCSRLQKAHIFCNRERFGRVRSSKVDDFGTNRMRVCDFLFVINSNFGPKLHRFGDTSTYWLKLPSFPTPLWFGAFAPYVPLGILRLTTRKLESWGYPTVKPA